jgi:3-phenylpropionate/cinnamic acid dioxygenase small subunit
VLEWLIEEGELLGKGQFEEWPSRIAPDLSYRMPVRTSSSKSDGDGISTSHFHFDEDRESMWVRVHRRTKGSAWAEDPPSRTRRFVSNLRVMEVSESELDASSYLLLTRSRGARGAARPSPVSVVTDFAGGAATTCSWCPSRSRSISRRLG